MLALLLALSSPVAAAEDRPGSDFLAAAGVTALTQVGGAAALGGAGFLAGGASCAGMGPEGECYAPAAGLVFGAGAGVAIGGPLGAALGARAVGARPLRAAGYTLAVEGLAIGLIAHGARSGSGDVVTSGLVLGLAGMPLAAGLAVVTDRGPRPPSPPVSLSPVIGPQRAGLVVSGRW